MMAEKQVDLFLDSLINAPMKDDRALMEFPFFSLQKAPRRRPLVYDDGKVKIEVRPGDRGIATIWDKDVLIYIASIINDRLERGLPVEQTVRFNAHNLLQVTGRGSGKRAYELLLDAMFRLRSTTIVTTIEADETKERRGFGWIETFRVLEKKRRNGQQVMAACEITLNDWMFRAIVKDRRVLTINNSYFDLTMGLKRRLYELARKHCGLAGPLGHRPAPADREVRLGARAAVLQAPAQEGRRGRRPARLPRGDELRSQGQGGARRGRHGAAALGQQRADPGVVLAARLRCPGAAGDGQLTRYFVHIGPVAPPVGSRRRPRRTRYIVHGFAARRAAPGRAIRYNVHNPQAGGGSTSGRHRDRAGNSVHRSRKLGTSFTVRFGTSFTEVRYIIHIFGCNPLIYKAEFGPLTL